MEGNQLFPVFIKLNTIHTVLVGAGPIGLEKLSALLDNSPEAKVTVIGIDVLPQLQTLADGYEGVNVLQKPFEPADLNGADLVIAATNNELLNQEIRIQASERNLLVNFADKPELCDFYLGSVVKKGDLKIAISTNGKSPTMAKRLKEVLNNGLPGELNDTLQNMQALRNTLNGDFAAKVKKLNEVTSALVEGKASVEGVVVSDGKPKLGKMKWLIWLAIVFAFAIVVAAFWHKEPEFQAFVANINPMFYWFLLGGFIFAMIDGAIGMSYGVTSTSFSLAMGVPPASASMGVHLSEILSNGIAGWMHYRFGNVNWKLFKLLLIPGIIGAVTGAYLLSSLEHYSHYTKPIVSLYTLILGFVILSKAYQANRKSAVRKNKIKKIGLLGLFGGFIDAVGGGGWGSIVLSSLIAGGRNARFSLGTVKITRFFIALMSSLTFITMLNGAHWEAVAGLVIGSALASPIAAKVSNRISAKTIMVSVGILVVLVSLRSIVKFILELV
ncbi:TSUP family transporter [Pedobacter heparinus]|uniref:Probable membrane transporter protein n=1 Tax=Pedobacter heparinus (strain ATCC 13125 / DSM 2366 / CIP 104194 / JCM 7457 / NBRC 12017 / NCIMB 9290 / NRRL B-14731 / HIM 762-3) TaxID=485917 RepID=C6Y362_PEDHD|nr:TSUP family transporter [Pedobacter heparinus]ACU05287.1 siroheme synthase [Pedobacter heparinus DSM 2366]